MSRGRPKGSKNKNNLSQEDFKKLDSISEKEKGQEKPMENKELDKKLSELEKNFGLERASSQKKVDTIRTDIYALDFVLDGIKVCEGCHKIELYGNPSCGKTTFAKKIVAKYQKLGKICVWIVSESFHEDWAKKMGIDTDKLLKYHPDSVEDACEKLLAIAPKVDLIVVDSVASLIPEAELQGTLSDKTRGAQAKAYSEFTRKLYNTMAKQTTTLIFINQIRIVMGKLYGNPEDTPCGKALKHMYDTRIEFKTGKPIDQGVKEDKERIGIEIRLHGYKNKLGVAKRSAVVDFYFENGYIDNKTSLLFAGLKYNVIDLEGKTYSFADKKIVGKKNFEEALTDKDWKKIETQIWERS